MRCFRKAPSSKVGLRDTPRLLRSEQHQLLGDDTATTGRDRVGLLVYERGEGGCTVSDTVRVRDLWLFPVGPCRLGNLVYTYCLVWLAAKRRYGMFWQAFWSQPVYLGC